VYEESFVNSPTTSSFKNTYCYVLWPAEMYGTCWSHSFRFSDLEAGVLILLRATVSRFIVWNAEGIACN